MYKDNMWTTNRNKSAKVVETKTGLVGKVLKEPLINGKVRVYTEKGNLLCDPQTLKLKGFIDYKT